MSFSAFLKIIYQEFFLSQISQPHTGVVLFSKQHKLEQYFKLTQLDQADTWIGEHVANHEDVYFTVTLQDAAANSALGKTRSSKGACAFPGIWTDIDVVDDSGAHKTKELPTEAQARDFLASLPISPSLIINTGHGFHAYWLLDNAQFFADDTDREAAAGLVKGFQSMLRKRMSDRGWKLDSTQDLARLLRIPGTKNFKCDPPLDVRLEQGEVIQRYARESLAALIEPDPKQSGDTKPAKDKHRDKSKKKTGAPAYCSGILKRCGFIKHTQIDAATLSEPEWYSMICVLAHAADGAKVIHSISVAYPEYVFAETEAKIAHSLVASGPMTCQKIYELTGGEYCRRCSYFRRIATPLQLGAAPFNGEKEPIFMTCELDEELKQVEAALAQCEDLFHRGGRLVRVVPNALTAPAGAKHSPLEIQDIHASTLREMLCSVRLFFKPTQSGVVAQYPPDQLVVALKERGQYAHLRHLRDITEVPVLRHDGTVLQEPGYDKATELFYEPCSTFPPISDNPTAEDVQQACALLKEVVADFPFTDRVLGEAVFIAVILTVVGRFAFRGPSPMILIDANMPGTGKTKLADVAGIITTGMTLPRVAQTKNEEEERKRITSILLKGRRILLLDNISSRLGNGVLDALLTSETWQDRILGHSREVSLPNNLLVIATGNNLELQADTVRRCLRVQLVSREEHPEARSTFLHPDLEPWVAANQPQLLAAALTILRAYVVAGRPKQEMRTLGSYSGWAQLVQAAVKWATGIDPGDARIPFEENVDLDSECLQLLMAGWRDIAPHGEALNCRQAIERMDRSLTAGKVLHDAMDLMIPGSKHSTVDLGRLLKRFRKRVRDGAYFDHAGTNKGCAGFRWKLVEAVSPDHDDAADAVGHPSPEPEMT